MEKITNSSRRNKQKRVLHIEKKIIYGKIIHIVKRDIQVHRKEVYKKDTHGEDVEIEKDIIDLQKRYSDRANL